MLVQTWPKNASAGRPALVPTSEHRPTLASALVPTSQPCIPELLPIKYVVPAPAVKLQRINGLLSFLPVATATPHGPLSLSRGPVGSDASTAAAATTSRCATPGEKKRTTNQTDQNEKDMGRDQDRGDQAMLQNATNRWFWGVNIIENNY